MIAGLVERWWNSLVVMIELESLRVLSKASGREETLRGGRVMIDLS